MGNGENALLNMDIPASVHTIVSAYLQAVDAAVPCLLEGLYLVGSVALGDFRAHRSDIDFVALTPARLDAAQVRALSEVHSRIGKRWRRPYFDGIYATWADLAADPRRLDRCHVAHEGRLAPAGEGDLIAWFTLARHGVAFRGPVVESLRVWSDAAALAEWTDRNLDDYWQRRVLDRGASLFTRAGLVGLGAWYCEWCVTGVSRLHYTLATGDVISKYGAASYALATFAPRWSRVIEEALRIRRAGSGRSLYRSR